MEKNKICTTIEQSKKLLELGLDRKTSDMYYWCGSDLIYSLEGLLDIRIGGYQAQDKELDVPAWSLFALLELFDDKVGLAKEYGTWFAYDNGKSHCSMHCDNPIDAAFEMVCWLLENKKNSILCGRDK